MGGTAPAVLNAADEVAVDAFLNGRIRFTDIPSVIRNTLDCHEVLPASSIDVVMGADERARRIARGIVENCPK